MHYSRFLTPCPYGRLIAVSYEARASGVKRSMRLREARRHCPSLVAIQVPTRHGKSDIGLYRHAGAAVLQILAKGADQCERASIDEVYLDLTVAAHHALQTRSWPDILSLAAGSHVAGVERIPELLLSREELRRGHGGCAVDAEVDAGQLSAAWLARDDASQEERLLIAGAALVAERRADVLRTLGYTTSAGISINKLLAKLAAGLRKPAAQTIASPSLTTALLAELPVARLRGLGGMLGERLVAELGIQTVGELAGVPGARLAALLGEETAALVARLARGESDELVKAREQPASIGCSKNFRGALSLRSGADVEHWLHELALELEERLEEDATNSRRPQKLVVGWSGGGSVLTRSSTFALPAARISSEAASTFRRWAAGVSPGESPYPVTLLSLSATGFVEVGDAGSLKNLWGEPAALEESLVDGRSIPCPQCGAAVPAAKSAEHADWHFAKDLAASERRPAGGAKHSPSPGGSRPAGAKRARGAGGPLDSFLQRKGA